MVKIGQSRARKAGMPECQQHALCQALKCWSLNFDWQKLFQLRRARQSALLSSLRCPTCTHHWHHTARSAGWHPLTAALVDSFYPNSTSIGTSVGRISIVTGPNASGKSVYLEQVGIIVYLAHIGCFVPAQHARVGLTDRILMRMLADDGRDAMFARDLVQLGNILKAATSRSLLLIDEFGKVRRALCRIQSPHCVACLGGAAAHVSMHGHWHCPLSHLPSRPCFVRRCSACAAWYTPHITSGAHLPRAAEMCRNFAGHTPGRWNSVAAGHNVTFHSSSVTTKHSVRNTLS